MIAISIANSVGSRRSSAPVVVVPVATAATGVGETSFTANWNAFAGANYYLLDVSLNSSFSSFVGSYQNYVTIGTSQLVSGLTPNTTYYYRLRAVTGVDSDAAAFFSRVYTAGGVLSYTEVTATETLVYDMKTAGVWTAMKAVYPMVGASAAACAQNLKSSSFTGTFTSGWTFASTGVTGNGTSAYFDTTCNDNNFSANSSSFGVYSRTDIGRSVYDFGIYNSTLSKGTWMCLRNPGFSGGVQQAPPEVGVANSDSRGFYQMSKNGSTTVLGYKNSSQVISTASATTTATNTTFYLAALNDRGTPNFGYSTQQFAFAFLGDGLSGTNMGNFYTAVQTFNQTLSRSVGPQIVSDADAQAYIDRVYTAGGTLTNTEANAVNQLVIDMKGAGIWTAMKAVYPMVGSSASACAQNLKSSSFTGTFSSGWTFSSTGATPNGTSAYMDTGLVPNTNLSQNSSSGGSYINSLSAGSVNKSDVYFGASNSGFANGFYLLPMANGDNKDYSRNNTNAAPAASSWTDCRGFYQMYRTVSTSYVVRRNNTPTTYSIASVSPTTFPVWIAALNNAGTLTEPSSNRIALSYFGDGLTDTQASNFYTAVQAFQTTLGRAIAP